ncbi:MAG: RusA family crossover junction endodeoxyribonuclease [Proteobacteria bacterium]|nr:RusA family crossover junction endodeoxyribonuclease [Pseudomonadota bacterium]
MPPLHPPPVPVLAIELPWPPSVNNLYGCRGFRRYLSAGGKAYKRTVFRSLKGTPTQTGRLEIHVYAHPPDGRVRDLDNLLKITLDSLQYAKVVQNDYQFARVIIERKEVLTDGLLRIVISTF